MDCSSKRPMSGPEIPTLQEFHVLIPHPAHVRAFKRSLFLWHGNAILVKPKKLSANSQRQRAHNADGTYRQVSADKKPRRGT